MMIVGLFVSAYPVQADSPTPTELPDMRTESSKTFDNHDGTRGLNSYLGVIHYKDNYSDDAEQWKDIDTTIVNGRIDKAPYTLSIDGNTVTIKDKKTGSITTIGLDSIGGTPVVLSNPIEKGSVVSFKDVAKDTDVVIFATNSNVYFKRVLKSSDAPLDAVFAINQVGTGITVTPSAREQGKYNDIEVAHTFKDGKLTETIELYKVASLDYPLEIDPTIDVRVSSTANNYGISYNGAAWANAFTPSGFSLIGNYSAGGFTKSGGGFMFTSVAIPSSATITTSYINVTAFASDASNTVKSQICGQLGNSGAFSTVADYQARRGTDCGGANNNNRTVANVTWDSVVAFTVNTTYQSPSINTVVQEIVNGAWASGYNMTIFWDDHGGSSSVNAWRTAWFYNASASTYASLLHVDYTITAPTVVTQRCTGFGSNWLLFNGNITAYGSGTNITQAGFNYGTTTAYGATVENTYANYTIRSYGYYSYVSGLNSQTLYHYKANAYNGAWGYGGDKQFSTAGANVANSMQWEFNVNTIVGTRNVYGGIWVEQSFTTNDTAHTITSIDLWLQRNGSPGDVTVVLQNASGGFPYGTALSTGVIPAQYTGNINPISSNTTGRYSINMTPEVSLSANTQYCLTVKALMGDSSNYLTISQPNAGIYLYGSGYTSSDNGMTWADTGSSFLFSLWGHGCLQVDQAKVFNSYKSTGDWLITFFYRDVFPPYYPVQDSKQYFAYQLVDMYNNVIASQSCASWGAKPGSIYLSASSVVPLQWAGAYRVRLLDLRDSTVYMEYPLQPSDWLGSDLTLLDSWVISMAQQLQQYDNVPYVTPVAGRGNVLNSAGGVIFALGIPLLDSIRPNLFQVVSIPSSFTNTSYPQTMRQIYTPPIMLGTDAWATMNAIATLIGTDGRTIGAMGILLITLIVAGWGFQAGHTVAATVIVSPLMILGMLTGVIDLLIGAIVLAIAVGIFVWQVLLRGG